MPPDLAASMNPFSGKDFHEFMRAYRHMASFGFMIADSQTGTIRKSSVHRSGDSLQPFSTRR